MIRGRWIIQGVNFARAYAAPIAGILGVALFLAIVARLLLQSPQLKPHCFDQWDPFWLKTYAVATGSIGILVWCRRGKVLLLLAAGAGAALFFLPVLNGAAGWAVPKLAIITALAVGAGHRGLQWLRVPAKAPLLDRLLLSTLLGYGFLSLMMLALGLLYLWRAGPVTIVLSLVGVAVFRDFIAVCRRLIDEGVRPLWRDGHGAHLRLPALALSSVVLCASGCYACSVSPCVHWDVLHYHLGIPTIYVERGGIVPLEHTYAVHLLRNAEMLYGLGLLVEGQPLPTLFNFLFGLLAAGVVVSLGTLLADRRVGLLAGAIFFAVPLVSYVLTEGLIDVIPAAYVLAATYAFFQWQRERSAAWTAVFSAFVGLAVGTKLNAAIFLLPLCVMMLARSFRSPLAGRARLGDALWLLAPGLVALSPWLALTWLRTGNPCFPFLNNIFHSAAWHQNSAADGVDWSEFGVGKSWWYAVRLPWDLAFQGERFGELGWFATAGIVLLGLPFAYFAVPKRQRQAMLALALLTAFSLAVFFKVAQYARYMLPVTAFCAVVAAMNWQAAWRQAARCPRAKWLPLGACLALGLGWLCFTRAVHLSTLSHFHPGRYPWRFVLGKQSPDECLRQSSLTDYEFLKFLKEQIPEKPVVFVGAGLGAGTYCGDAIEYSRWHSLAGKRLIEETALERLLPMMREKQIRYLAINEPLVQNQPIWQRLMRDSAALRPQFRRHYCEPLFGRNGVVLYRLNFDGADVAAVDRAPSLFASELRVAPDGTLPGWGLASGKLAAPPSTCHPTDTEALVLVLTHLDCICQRCPVRENTLYSLSADSWSLAEKQGCMLQLIWRDKSGEFIQNEFSQQEVVSMPDRYELVRTSAADACYADVYLRARDGNVVFMSRPRLVECPSAPSHSTRPPAVASINQR